MNSNSTHPAGIWKRSQIQGEPGGSAMFFDQEVSGLLEPRFGGGSYWARSATKYTCLIVRAQGGD